MLVDWAQLEAKRDRLIIRIVCAKFGSCPSLFAYSKGVVSRFRIEFRGLFRKFRFLRFWYRWVDVLIFLIFVLLHHFIQTLKDPLNLGLTQSPFWTIWEFSSCPPHIVPLILFLIFFLYFSFIFTSLSILFSLSSSLFHVNHSPLHHFSVTLCFSLSFVSSFLCKWRFSFSLFLSFFSIFHPTSCPCENPSITFIIQPHHHDHNRLSFLLMPFFWSFSHLLSVGKVLIWFRLLGFGVLP